MRNLLNTKLTLLAVAVALSSNAWALLPSDGTPDLYLYVPGSQSDDPAFGFMVNGAAVANALCEQKPLATANNTNDTDTSTHVYFTTTGASSAGKNDNYSAIYCWTNSSIISALIPGASLTGGSTGISTGTGLTVNNRQRLWISRRRAGASFIGLDAASGTAGSQKAIDFLKDPTTANCTAYNGAESSGGYTYQYNFACTITTTGTVATTYNATSPGYYASAATSDVTPDVFNGDNATPTYPSINPAVFDNIHQLGGHVIGVPVTLPLRNALQYASYLSNPTGFPLSCVNSEAAACVPSFTKDQLASIWSGKIAYWDSFQINDTVHGSVETLPQAVAEGVTAGVAGLANPLDSEVHICRRENGAGQQVALLSTILQYPCLGSNGPVIASNYPSTNSFADVEYATSLGAVDNCLTDFATGPTPAVWFGTTNPSPYPNPPVASTPHGNQWAISVQTTERNATLGAPYRFIAIEGAAATGENSFLTNYPLVGNYSLSWKSAYNSPNQNTALEALAAYSKQPSVIVARNAALSQQPFGQAGYIALSDNGYTPPTTWTISNPTTPYSRLSSAGTPNACAVPTINQNFGAYGGYIQY
ncbi:MAG: hypothetical protein ABSB19_01325 [Methylomonas sp.]